MDNGTQFTGREFLEFCDDYHIRVDWAAVANPRMNGQVECTNSMVLQGLKPRIYNCLKKFAGRWVAELPAVLWSLRTTPSRATGYTPFFMVYGAEAILPTDLEYRSPRVRVWHPRCLHCSCVSIVCIMCLNCLKKDLFVNIKVIWVIMILCKVLFIVLFE